MPAASNFAAFSQLLAAYSTLDFNRSLLVAFLLPTAQLNTKHFYRVVLSRYWEPSSSLLTAYYSAQYKAFLQSCVVSVPPSGKCNIYVPRARMACKAKAVARPVLLYTIANAHGAVKPAGNLFKPAMQPDTLQNHTFSTISCTTESYGLSFYPRTAQKL